MSEQTMTIGKKKYVIPDAQHYIWKMIETAKPVIEQERAETFCLKDAKVQVVFIYPNISKSCVARIVRTSKELKLFSSFDYIIEFSGEIWDNINDKVRQVIVEHELRHVYTKFDDNSGAFKYLLVNHNVLDFKEILSTYGIEWFGDLQNKVVDLYANNAKIKDSDEKDVIDEKVAKLKEQQDKLRNSLKI
jgi:predicted metallopeptidase